ncbi:MAG: DNA repair ATPase [Pseudohongiella sp.]|nr:MAG: DNA repair ATPase [Pseudohongiella sp.]
MALMGIILSGCAAMSAEECVYSDWTAVGYEDGADGRSSDRFGDYRRACADHNITPDFEAWQAGRERGLIEYCQPLRGFQVGQSGGYYNGVCNASLEPGFMDAFRLGSELYGLRSNLNTIVSRIEANSRAILRIDSDVAEIESRIVLDETTQAERAQLLLDMRELSEIKGELELEADLLIEERTLAELALYEFESSVNSAGF